jgi:hypothetical protein
MSKLIDCVYVMNKKHQIVSFESVAEHLKGDGDSPIMGWNNPNTQVITVNKTQHEDGLADTFLHEILHVIDYNLQMKLTEEQVHALSAGILQTVWDKRNEQFFRLIFRFNK